MDISLAVWSGLNRTTSGLGSTCWWPLDWRFCCCPEPPGASLLFVGQVRIKPALINAADGENGATWTFPEIYSTRKQTEFKNVVYRADGLLMEAPKYCICSTLYHIQQCKCSSAVIIMGVTGPFAFRLKGWVIWSKKKYIHEASDTRVAVQTHVKSCMTPSPRAATHNPISFHLHQSGLTICLPESRLVSGQIQTFPSMWAADTGVGTFSSACQLQRQVMN